MSNTLNTVTSKTKPKHSSKGQRKHVRRMKQEARKTGIPGYPIIRKKTLSAPVVIKE